MAQDKRQRQRENRQKKLEAERKAARAKALRRRIIQVVVLFVIVVAVLGINSLFSGDEEAATTTSLAATDTTAAVSTTVPDATTTPTDDVSEPLAIPASYEDYRALPVACGGTLPDPVEPMQFDAPEDQGINPDDAVTATIVTSCGDIVLELDPASAPETVNSFVFLARQGYFNGQAFHRIVEGFMLQGGDPTATGTGNPGYLLPDELDAAVTPYPKGTIAMANSGVPNSGGSQFFIMFEDYPLGPTYSVFGKTIDSDATMDAIEALPKELRNGELSVPMEGLFIERVDVEVVPAS